MEINELKEDKQKLEIWYASLLHDIGKFKNRCVNNSGYHEKLNNELLKKHSQIINLLKKRYDNFLNCIILLGDRISSQERDRTDLEDINKNNDISKKPLINIFSRINEDKKKVDFCYINSIKNGFNNFNKLNLKSIENFEFNEELYLDFEEEFMNIYNDEISLDNFYKIYNLLEKYTINISGSAKCDLGDISLFNHSKISCAVSSCLYEAYKKKVISEDEIIDLNSKVFDFFRKKIKGKDIQTIKNSVENVCVNSSLNKKYFLEIICDFSGIQNFIYNITSKQALKNLKVRSFILEYLSKLFSNYLIEYLKLNPSNLIFASGGNFKILTYNSEDIKNDIKIKINEFNDNLYSLFSTKIFLSLSFNEISAIDFSIYNPIVDGNNDDKNIDKVISKQEKFFNNIIKSKNQKEDFFVIDNENIENIDIEKFYVQLKQIQKNNKITIENFNEINKLLDFKKYSSFYFGKKDLNINTCNKNFQFLSLGIAIKNNNNLNKVEMVDLGKSAQSRTGSNYVGAVKLDIDNLGDIFSKGLKKEDNMNDKINKYDLKIYSRHTELSYRISYFFEGFISYLQKEYEFKRDSNLFFNEVNKEKLIKFDEEIDIIYSGGDDCFFVGSFDSVLEFLNLLYFSFTNYVGVENKTESIKNSQIHFSSVYGVYNPKTPIYSIANDLENKLEIIKNNGKNGCYFVCGQIKWYEFNKLKSFFNNLYHLVKRKENRSLCHRFSNSVKGINSCLKKVEQNRLLGKDLVKLEYYLAREFKKYTDDENKNENQDLIFLIDYIKEIIFQKLENKGDEINLDIIKIASRLVELFTKNLNSKSDDDKNEVKKR